MALPILDLRKRLCLNGHAIPVVEESLVWLDPYHLLDKDMDDTIDVNLVKFVCQRSNLTWLSKAMRMSLKWWCSNHHEVPLFSEILEAIKQQKPTRGSTARLPRKQSLVVALKVRGKTLFFQNTLASVILAFQDTETEDLHWFLQELYQDIKMVKNRVRGKDEPAEPANHEDEEPADSDDEPAEVNRKRHRPGPPEDIQGQHRTDHRGHQGTW